MTLRVVQLLALVLMAVALVPAGAHLFELPHKLNFERDAYFTVQGIYAGWALFGVVYFSALAANLSLSIMVRRQRQPFIFALVGFGAIVLFFAVFFTWTCPANQATANWTQAPENWRALRRAWELSHAANAVILFCGFVAVALSVITAKAAPRAP